MLVERRPVPLGGRASFEALSVLVDDSLVQPRAGSDGARFELLETIRAFTGDRLEARHETGALRRRHALAYLELVEAAARLWRSE